MANMWMSERRWLVAVGEMGKLKDIDYISRYATENLGSKYEQTLTY